MARASARHILVATEEACLKLKQEIEGGADFAACAQEHSLCPAKRVKEFDDVVFSAEVGTVQGPVKTQFGYHLVEVTSRTA